MTCQRLRLKNVTGMGPWESGTKEAVKPRPGPPVMCPSRGVLPLSGARKAAEPCSPPRSQPYQAETASH